MVFQTLKWVGGADGYLEIIDQRELPGAFLKLRCVSVEEVFEAIKTLAVRGGWDVKRHRPIARAVRRRHNALPVGGFNRCPCAAPR